MRPELVSPRKTAGPGQVRRAVSRTASARHAWIRRAMAGARTPPPCRMLQKTIRIGEPRLLVEPDLLQATAVVRHLVRDQVLHVGIVCEAIGAPAHGGPGRVLLELLLDLPDERQPLRGVDLLRLLIDQPAYLLVAVVAVVAGGPA